MATTIREQIIAAFATRLALVRALPGYASVLIPADDRDLIQTFDTTFAVLPVVAQFVTDITAENPITDQHDSQAQELIGQTIKTALTGDDTLGGLCDSILYDGAETDYRDVGSQKFIVRVNFAIRYRCDRDDPYIQSE